MGLSINDSVYSCLFFFLTGLHFFHLLVGLLLCCLLFWSSSFESNFYAWRLHPKTRKQGKGMLEVPWLAVTLRKWFAVTRSTFLFPSSLSSFSIFFHCDTLTFFSFHDWVLTFPCPVISMKIIWRQGSNNIKWVGREEEKKKEKQKQNQIMLASLTLPAFPCLYGNCLVFKPFLLSFTLTQPFPLGYKLNHPFGFSFSFSVWPRGREGKAKKKKIENRMETEGLPNPLITIPR